MVINGSKPLLILLPTAEFNKNDILNFGMNLALYIGMSFISTAIVLYLSEEDCGLAYDNCQKTVYMDVSNYRSSGTTSQNADANNSTVSFTLKGQLESVGAKYLLPIIDQLFQLVNTWPQFRMFVAFYHKSILMPYAYISAFGYKQNDENGTVDINITLTSAMPNIKDWGKITKLFPEKPAAST